MACKRSAVRSRLAPPAFAGCAWLGSASLVLAKAGQPSCQSECGTGATYLEYEPWQIKTSVAFADENRAAAFGRYLKSGICEETPVMLNVYQAATISRRPPS